MMDLILNIYLNHSFRFSWFQELGFDKSVK